MDAIEVLLHDHREIRQYIEQFRSADDDEAKQEAFEKLVDELDHHTAMEEEVFYPRVMEKVPSTEDEVREGIEEHHAARVMIDEAQAIGPDDEQWEAKATVVCESVEHHVDEEESDLFPKVRGGLDVGELGMLAADLQAFKARFELGQHTVDELRAQAAEADIEGRGRMTKAELVEALARPNR